MLTITHPSSRQPSRLPWTIDTFIHECTVAASNSIDLSTQQTYGSALNSWLAFVEMHHFPIEPSIDTLSFFVVYMSHHISPWSVKLYLSGLVQLLEPKFPQIREIRSSLLVSRVMKGCLKMRNQEVKRKKPLSIGDLQFIDSRLRQSRVHDDILFAALISTGFHGLLRLGELTFPDSPALCDWRKVTKRSTVTLQNQEYEFFLPAHKVDRFFEGNRVVIRAFSPVSFNPCPIFFRYLSSRDHLFPTASPLWLTSTGSVPTRSFFMSWFRLFFSKSFGGASM